MAGTFQRPSAVALGLAFVLLGACQKNEPTPQAPGRDSAPAATSADVVDESLDETLDQTWAYLLARYDTDGDAVIRPAEYTRHDGQLARWDTNADGLVSAADWGTEDPLVSPQIDILQRRDALGRYFQTDENELEVLTIDELANAFLEYDGAGNGDEELSEAEFRALAQERAVAMPGDGSLMMQSYIGEEDGWERLTRLFDLDGSGSLDLMEVTALYEESDLYELRFDQVRFDGGVTATQFDNDAYEVGLPAGSPVPDVTLTTLHENEPVSLSKLAGTKPMALIFGSYT